MEESSSWKGASGAYSPRANKDSRQRNGGQAKEGELSYASADFGQAPMEWMLKKVTQTSPLATAQ